MRYTSESETYKTWRCCMDMNDQLIFIYNADSGMFNTLSDMAHKLFSPQTYACDLCRITHGVFTEREEWRAFIESLPISCAFMHRDEFHRQYPDNRLDDLPALLLQHDEALHPFMDKEDIASCDSIGALSEQIMRRLEERGIRAEDR